MSVPIAVTLKPAGVVHGGNGVRVVNCWFEVQFALFTELGSHIDLTCQLYTDELSNPFKVIVFVYVVSKVQEPVFLYLIL